MPTSNSSGTRYCLLRLLVMVGTTLGVALVVMAITRARSSSSSSSHRALSAIDGRNGSHLGARSTMLGGPPGPRFHREDRGWPPHGDEWREHHGHHDHGHHGHDEDNDDDDDSKDDDEDDSDSSQSGSASNNEAESAAIQSSVVTNLDGINIGNTITIINIGTGSQGNSSGSADDYGYGWNEKAPNDDDSLPVSDSDRSAITSAAVRAFCESIDCGRPKSFKGTATAGGPAPITPAFSAGNQEAGNEVQHEKPAAKSSGSAVNTGLARWLVLIAIIIQLR